MHNSAISPQEPNPFVKKVWQAAGIITLIVIILWICFTAVNVLMLILMALLVSIFFQRLAGLIRKKTGWKQGLSLAISILGTVLLLALLFWFVGAQVQQQIAELTDQLPQMLQQVKSKLGQSPLGKRVMEQASSMGSGSGQQMGPSVQRFFTTSFGVLGDLFAILFLGIFFTISPNTYVNGFIKLMPTKAKPEAHHVLTETGNTLAQWLKGQLFAMLVVAVLTGIGLAIIGMPLVLALALIAGLFNFVPNIGPLISAVPAILVSLQMGGNAPLFVAGLYLLVQALESNLITPYIQNKMISIPPALILIGQLIFGTLFGIWGIILATPLVAILMVVLQELYVKKQQPQLTDEALPK